MHGNNDVLHCLRCLWLKAQVLKGLSLSALHGQQTCLTLRRLLLRSPLLSASSNCFVISSIISRSLAALLSARWRDFSKAFWAVKAAAASSSFNFSLLFSNSNEAFVRFSSSLRTFACTSSIEKLQIVSESDTRE